MSMVEMSAVCFLFFSFFGRTVFGTCESCLLTNARFVACAGLELVSLTIKQVGRL